MLKEKLYNILRRIDQMKSKDEALERCVSHKLDNSLEMYMEDVKRTCDYLLSRSNCKVIKSIARQSTKED